MVTSFLNPVLFLTAMGLGLGSFVDRNGSEPLGDVRYVVFLAPGLLAATCMQTAATEATYPVMAAIKWIRTYHGMLATPLRVVDVLRGHLAYMAARLAQTAALFFVVMLAFGAVRTPAAVLAIPAAALTGLAFATPLTAFAATIERDSGFPAVFRFVIMPMYLFSGTFFPVAQLPDLLEVVAFVTPLWHGVELCRDLALGDLHLLGGVGHVVYLCAWATGGYLLAARQFTKRLVD
jgi:lipooligosaccharide transport system permease protein